MQLVARDGIGNGQISKGVLVRQFRIVTIIQILQATKEIRGGYIEWVLTVERYSGFDHQIGSHRQTVIQNGQCVTAKNDMSDQMALLSSDGIQQVRLFDDDCAEVVECVVVDITQRHQVSHAGQSLRCVTGSAAARNETCAVRSHHSEICSG